jgi:DNA invertase Pin-like site-specific DNA recombinase
VEQAASVELQIANLTKAGCVRIWSDLGVSGGTMHRGEFAKMLDHARAGDVIVVTKLDRFGRTVRGILELVEQLQERGISLRTLDGIDTSDENPGSRFMLAVMSAFSELELSLIRLRTKEAAAARRDPATGRMRGNLGGRPRAIKGSKAHAQVRAMYEAGSTAKEVAATLKVSESTVRRSLRASAR